jgi:hypothetical protein
MRSRKILLATLAFAAATAKWLSIPDARDHARPVSEPEPIQSTAESAPYPARSNVVAPRQFVDPARPAIETASRQKPPEDEPSHLADELHSPERTAVDDLGVVMNLFTEYRIRFRGFPVGEDNATFVNALTGRNPSRLAFLPPKHAAIDAQGQLLDRWGKPFFFHLLGRDALEIRSAGPDQKLYTADDLVKASPKAKEATLALKAN